jgi:predicted transcriptional regulator
VADVPLGERELDVMAVLWEMGSGTVAEVRKRLPARLAYTTVLTILRNLEAKGFVTHDAEQRTHRYRPRLDRQRVRRSALGRLIDTLFHGSAEQLVAHLVDERAVSAEELGRLARASRTGAGPQRSKRAPRRRERDE